MSSAAPDPLNNVVEMRGQARERQKPLEFGGGGGDSGGMEARVAVLEQIAKSTESTLKEIKDDLRGLRDDMGKKADGLRDDMGKKADGLRDDMGKKADGLRDRQERDFRILFGATITVALALATLMAKGFGWL